MNTKQLCDICGLYLPPDPFDPCVCVSRQAPEFYVGEGAIARRGDFVVSVVGQMKIIMTDPDDPKNNLVLRDNSDLFQVGIKTDEDFDRLYALGESEFYLDESPWFEVYSTLESETYSDPIYELDEAVALMIEWHEQETERE